MPCSRMEEMLMPPDWVKVPLPPESTPRISSRWNCRGDAVAVEGATGHVDISIPANTAETLLPPKDDPIGLRSPDKGGVRDIVSSGDGCRSAIVDDAAAVEGTPTKENAAGVQLAVLDQAAGPVVFQYNVLFWAWASEAVPARSTAVARPKNPVAVTMTEYCSTHCICISFLIANFD